MTTTRSEATPHSKAPARVKSNSESAVALAWQAMGSMIASERKRMGWSRQSDLAESAGVSLSTIANIEAGTKVSKKTLRAIEEAFDWRVGYLDECLLKKQLPKEPPTAGPESSLVDALYTIASELEEEDQRRLLRMALDLRDSRSAAGPRNSMIPRME